jgi:hypothetical protein
MLIDEIGCKLNLFWRNKVFLWALEFEGLEGQNRRKFFSPAPKLKDANHSLKPKIATIRACLVSPREQVMVNTIASYKYLRKSPCETNCPPVRDCFDPRTPFRLGDRNFGVFPVQRKL